MKMQTMKAYEKQNKKRTVISFALLMALTLTMIVFSFRKSISFILLSFVSILLIANALIYVWQNGVSIGILPIAVFALLPGGISLLIARSDKISAVFGWMIVFLSGCTVAYFVCAFFKMAKTSGKKSFQSGTLLVAGTSLKEKDPSLTLKDRLDLCLKLAENTNAMIIVSGKDSGNGVSEAKAMKEYLAQKGIDQNRVILEENAANTQENLQFADLIMKKNHLPVPLVVVSSDYHMYRIEKYASEMKLPVFLMPARTNLISFLPEWSREALVLHYYKML